MQSDFKTLLEEETIEEEQITTTVEITQMRTEEINKLPNIEETRPEEETLQTEELEAASSKQPQTTQRIIKPKNLKTCAGIKKARAHN